MNRIKRIVIMTIIALFVVTGLVSGGTPVVANASPAKVVSNASAHPNGAHEASQRQAVTTTTTTVNSPQTEATAGTTSTTTAETSPPAQRGAAPLPSDMWSVNDTCKSVVVITDYYSSGRYEGGRAKQVTTQVFDDGICGSDAGGVSPDESLSGWIPPPPAGVLSRTIDVARERDSCCFQSILFRYHQSIRWSWIWSTVYNITVSSYWTNVDPFYTILSTVMNDTHYFYMLGWGNPYSGYFTRRQGHIRFNACWPAAICQDFYPWVILRAHGDGGATWQRGD